ncbi:cupin domain-containing protein [Streptacidiphilus jiangxiensis]|uniref:Cupin domain-containing protein n=1 Tax=Streptacidiphilus jiangxiensis TaxID=235985 RepID=A0A1H7JNZ5_STRJI|nr:cupin domain-containing protein [Streptacidiphilus jiangxiensis]SEK76124.1 Cupin domain-containing protein [Streptacidiphilus jiangxiensis]
MTAPVIVTASELPPVRWDVQECRVLLRAEHTYGELSLVEFITPPGTGPRPHVHHREAETFYVLDGAYEFLVGDRTVRAEPGTLVHGPSGITHGFRNVGDTPARLLCAFTPGGVETMFEEMAALLASPGPVDPADIAALISYHGVSSPRTLQPAGR